MHIKKIKSLNPRAFDKYCSKILSVILHSLLFSKNICKKAVHGEDIEVPPEKISLQTLNF